MAEVSRRYGSSRVTTATRTMRSFAVGGLRPEVLCDTWRLMILTLNEFPPLPKQARRIDVSQRTSTSGRNTRQEPYREGRLNGECLEGLPPLLRQQLESTPYT